MSQARSAAREDAVEATRRRQRESIAETAQEFGLILYVSSKPEPDRFSILLRGVLIPGHFDRHRDRLVWRVPLALVEAMDMHDHVKSGRVVKVT